MLLSTLRRWATDCRFMAQRVQRMLPDDTRLVRWGGTTYEWTNYQVRPGCVWYLDITVNAPNMHAEPVLEVMFYLEYPHTVVYQVEQHMHNRVEGLGWWVMSSINPDNQHRRHGIRVGDLTRLMELMNLYEEWAGCPGSGPLV